MAERVSFTSVIRNRGFLNLWINQILVQLSYNALNFTLILWVFKLTGSNIAVATLLFFIYLPAVILGLFSGVLVDLINKKKIIMLIDMMLCLLFLSLILLKEFYPAILVVAFLINALGQFYAPTEASAVPMIVKRKQLITANSIISTTLYTTFLVGFGLSGFLINHFGINFIFLLGGFILFTAFGLSFLFPTIYARPTRAGKKLIFAILNKNYLQIKEVGLWEILQTIRMIRGKLPLVTSILILGGVQMVVGVLAVLIPSFLERVLHIRATDASYIMVIPVGVGIVLGGFILGKFGHSIIRRVVVSKAIVFSGLLFMLVGIAPIVSPAIKYLPHSRPLSFITQPPLSAVLIVGSFLMGVAMVSILVPSQTVLQENTSNQDRGKVFATLGVAMAGLSLIPVLLTGILADVFGTNPIFLGLGIIIFLVGLFGLKPSLFFKKAHLSYHVREFLGLGHWEN
ncbi:MAG: MFS transporter [Candidatus Daviesbacteria bacterium]|nr:MFS transporter [Candidatus Daviesbacteria bacterium]